MKNIFILCVSMIFLYNDILYGQKIEEIMPVISRGMVVSPVPENKATVQGPAPYLSGSGPFSLASGDADALHTAEFIGGGIVGTFVGLGIGHAVQDRYLPLGLVFTLTEVIAMGGVTFTCVPFFNKFFDSRIRRWKKDAPLCAISLAVLYGLKAWEAYDVWTLPSSYKLVSKDWQIMPTYSYNTLTRSSEPGIAVRFDW